MAGSTMVLILTRWPIAYYATPKVASTSIKVALYELDEGEVWRDQELRPGEVRNIHNGWYPGSMSEFSHLEKSNLFEKFAVIRDPIERFLSAYRSRVRLYGELGESFLNSSLHEPPPDLPSDPGLGTFVDRLEEYCRVSTTIAYHVRSQSFYIGKDLRYFDRVFRFERLSELGEYLSSITGRPTKIDHHQRSPADFADRLTPAQIEKLTHFYRDDYRLLRDFYSRPYDGSTLNIRNRPSWLKHTWNTLLGKTRK